MMTPEEIILEQSKLLVEHRKHLDEIKKDLSDIKHRNVVADLEMMNLPLAIFDAKERTTRQNLIDLMRKISWRNGTEIINLWRMLYREFNIRYGIDLKIESTKRNMKKVDFAEKFGHIEHLYSLAQKLYL